MEEVRIPPDGHQISMLAVPLPKHVLISGWVYALRIARPFWVQTLVHDNSYRQVRRFRLGTPQPYLLESHVHLDQLAIAQAFRAYVVPWLNVVLHVHAVLTVQTHLTQVRRAHVPILWSAATLPRRILVRALRDF